MSCLRTNVVSRLSNTCLHVNQSCLQRQGHRIHNAKEINETWLRCESLAPKKETHCPPPGLDNWQTYCNYCKQRRTNPLSPAAASPATEQAIGPAGILGGSPRLAQEAELLRASS